jgi:hypothetical protein
MYAVGHTSHNMITLSANAEEKVRAKFSAWKSKKHPSLFGRCVIKGEVWSFFETRSDATGHLALLMLHGNQG